MLRITRIEQFNCNNPPLITTNLQTLISKRIQQLEPSVDLTATGDQLWVVEVKDDLVTDYLEIGNAGLYSDTFEEHSFGKDEFVSPLEFIAHHAEAKACELACQLNDEATIVIFIPHEVIEQKPNLQEFLLFLQHQQLVSAGEESEFYAE